MMNPRRVRNEYGVPWLRSARFGLLLAGIFLLAAFIVVLVYGQRPAEAPAIEQGLEQLAAETPAPAPKEMVDFLMADLDHGWIQYSDGAKAFTEDGGLHWQNEASGLTEEILAGNEAWIELLNVERKLEKVAYASKEIPVKHSQFLTDRIGWVLLSNDAELRKPLLVTIDGGKTWTSEVTPEVRGAMQEEKSRLQQMGEEAALYASMANAKFAIRSKWVIIPDTAAPGDVVLVRHDQPGEVKWLEKPYTLQPFGAGYYAYLPIPIQIKPGEYPIGEALLTIQDKKFDTQYIQVTKQMENMRQDTQRIQADQRKIDLARSKSESEFLFSSAFIQPVEGILTTPYGYTRYVNGKYDSSHRAIDLAAKEGTPVKATNDGIVALADSLYLTGNSIYIDHGMSLFSQYAHLSELRVKEGDRVKRGDTIGLVGSTGFSTGPHLHFTFWAHNVPVNPNLFFNTTPFHWLRQ